MRRGKKQSLVQGPQCVANRPKGTFWIIAPTHSINDLLWLQRLPALIGTSMAAILGVLAVLLAAVGIYGVMAYLVSQRTHEIGMRMALASDKADAMAVVLKQGMPPVAVGIILGF